MLSWQDQRTAPTARALRDDDAGDPCGDSAGCRSTRCSRATKARWLLDRTTRPRRAAGDVPRHRRLWLLSRLGGEPRDRGRQRRAHAAARRPHRATGRRSCSSCSASRATCCPRVVPPTGPFPAARGLAPLPRRHAGRRRDGRLARRAVRPRRLAPGPGQGDLRHRLLDHGPRPTRRPATPAAVPDGRLGRRPRPAHAFEGNIRSTRRDADLAGRAARHDARRARRRRPRTTQRRRPPRPRASAGSARPWWDDDAVGLISGLTFGTRVAAAGPRGAGVDRLPGRGRRWPRSTARSARCETLLADGGATAQPHAHAAAGGHERPPRRARRSPPSCRRSASRTSPAATAGVWTQAAAGGARAPARALRAGEPADVAARAASPPGTPPWPAPVTGGDRTCLALSPRPSS